MNVKMRVKSAWKAVASRSLISVACASNESGMPSGLSAKSMSDRCCAGPLNPALDLTHVVEVVGHLGTIVRPETSLQRARLGDDGVEDAAVVLQLTTALRLGAGIAEAARTPRAD